MPLRPAAMLVAACVLLSAAAALTGGASGGHDPQRFFAGRWTATFEATPRNDAATGEITFRAVPQAEAEAKLNELGLDPCPAPSAASVWYVGTYGGGIGQSRLVSGVSPTGQHAGCVVNDYEGRWKAIPSGHNGVLSVRNRQVTAHQWYFAGAPGQSQLFNLSFASHFPADGAEEHADSDGDGLLDEWETKGYDANGDGRVDVDLPKMGADPKRKDIFVEVDKMIGHPFDRSAVAEVLGVFYAAPVGNPDGSRGIALHIDNGPNTIMNGRGETWGALSRSNPLPHQDVLGRYVLLVAGDYLWGGFDAIKQAHFDAARRDVFHYAVFGHRYGSAFEDSGGISRGLLSASDFIVTLAGACPAQVDCNGTIEQQAAVFIHELGHNLGLGHGGDVDDNYKPNYLSIMNYSFSWSGLLGASDPRRFTLSSFDPTGTGGATSTLSLLDENRLVESAGFGALGRDLAGLSSVYYCPGGAATRKAILTGARDWNCNNRIDADPVAVDLNKDGKRTVLTPFNDWSHLDFEGGTIGAGASAPAPQTTPGRDAPAKELVRAAQIALGDTRPPTVTLAGPRKGKRVRLIVTARDDKALALVVVTIDGKTNQLPVKRSGQKVFRASVTVTQPGKRVVRAAAVDRAGGRSKTATARLRIR